MKFAKLHEVRPNGRYFKIASAHVLALAGDGYDMMVHDKLTTSRERERERALLCAAVLPVSEDFPVPAIRFGGSQRFSPPERRLVSNLKQKKASKTHKANVSRF